MRNLINLLIKLLSVAVLVVNLIYIQRGQMLNLDSWLSTLKPIFFGLVGLSILAFIGLMFTNRASAMTKLVLFVLLIALMFPFYHGYLPSFLHF